MTQSFVSVLLVLVAAAGASAPATATRTASNPKIGAQDAPRDDIVERRPSRCWRIDPATGQRRNICAAR